MNSTTATGMMNYSQAEMVAAMNLMTVQMVQLQEWTKQTADNIDQFFLITMGMIIYLMQAGFAFLEAGSVRSKNTTNILIKNLLDSFISGFSYWIFGYSFAFGEGNSFIGYQYFAHYGMPDLNYAHWFFQFVFAATAATIVSGAVAERCDFMAYLFYSSLITGFIYPVVTHWAWASDGWLLQGATYVNSDGTTFDIAYADFAGSGVVHMVGGLSAFIAAAMMGARKGKFDEETGHPQEIKGHSVPLASLGGFILVFGFFAFNGSSQGAISNPGDGAAVSIAVKNTVIAATAGAFTTMFVNKSGVFGDAKWSLLTTLNGCLTAMVAICAGCNQVYTWAAFCIGVIGGIAYLITTWLVLKFKVDDPLDATAVHFGGGVWGVISVGFFSIDNGILLQWNRASGLQLGWQLCGATAIFAWTAALCLILFGVLRAFNLLRCSEEYELKGLDIPKHGEPAYPSEAYGHGWGEKGDALGNLMQRSLATMQHRDAGAISLNRKTTEHPEVNAMRKRNTAGSTDSGINVNGSNVDNTAM